MYEYQAKIVNVVDGDTVDAMIDLGFGIFSKQRLRLYGVDTPEIKSPNPAVRQMALNAKGFVSFIIQNAPTLLTLKTYKDDKYGRLLADIKLPAPNSPMRFPIQLPLNGAPVQSIKDIVWDTEITLSELLVKNNLAQAYNGLGPKPAPYLG